YRQGQPAAEQNAAQEEQSQTAEQQANQGQETSNTRIDRLDGVLNGMLHVKQAAALHDYNGDQKVDLNEFLGEGRQQGKHSDLVQEDIEQFKAILEREGINLIANKDANTKEQDAAGLQYIDLKELPEQSPVINVASNKEAEGQSL